ncbi:MAG: hypothetical protein FJX04_10255 [Alphaproteobacteria bacterium]|nr:hypothetical protein [Alphaproteobacteria bacterium]
MEAMRRDARRNAVAFLILILSVDLAVAARKIPLPPRRPPELEQSVQTIPAPLNLAPKINEPSVESVQSAPALEDLSREDLIIEINRALTSLKQFSAKFSQIDQSGQTVTGQLLVLRPGRLRFDYNPPSALRIIADGYNVSVIDQRLGTKDLYSIGLTPLKFLLSRSIDLNKEFKLGDIQIEKDRVTLEAEDKATFGGSSQIILNFDRKTLHLKGWAVTDPQGYSVTVKLTQIDTKHELDLMNFVVPDTVTPIK